MMPPVGKPATYFYLCELTKNSGEGGIRTRDRFPCTRFPSERTRPAMRPLHSEPILYQNIGSLTPDFNQFIG